MAAKHPLGISILAVLLLLPSPFLLCGGIALAAIFTIQVLKEGLEESGLIIILLGVGTAILGIVCAKAGFDLWRLKRSARAPTIFLMCMIAVFTGDALLIGFEDRAKLSRAWLRGWAGVFAFSALAVAYLCLPHVRRKLERNGDSRNHP